MDSAAHSTRRVADGASVPALTGGLAVPGFEPGASDTVQWWDTQTSQPQASETVAAQPATK